MIYIIVFAVSLILMKLSFISSKKFKTLSFILLALSFIIPCILSGLRSYDIGTDVKVYIVPLFNRSLISSNFLSLVKNTPEIKDYLYLFLTYISAKTFKNVFFVFFFITLVTIIPTYKALKLNLKNENQILFGMLVFYTVLYNASFNMCRQSIALSFSFLAISYLIRNEEKKFFIISIITILFHWSGTILFVIYVLHKITSSKKLQPNSKFLFQSIFILMITFMIFFLPKILPLLKVFGFSDHKIISYSVGYLLSSRSTSNTADTCFFIIIYLLLAFNSKYLKEKNGNYNFFKFLALAGIFILQFGTYISFAFRASYYFLYPPIFLEIPKLIGVNKKKGISLYSLLLISMFCFYWFFWVIIANYHDTYPYIFRNF